jgi:YidC/Oxa1 family membrane protein insertase
MATTPTPLDTVAPITDATTTLSDVIIPAMQFGDLKAYGLCNFTPVGLVQWLMELTQVTTQLPFWGTIVLTTVGVRLLLLPVAIRSQRHAARMSILKPEMDRITSHITRARESNDYMNMAKYSQELQDLLKTNNAKPSALLMMPLIQAPVMISFFLALRKMSEAHLPWLQTGGAMWFMDLNAPDTTYGLPVAAGIGFLGIFELGSDTGTTQQLSKGVKNFFRVFSLAIIPFMASLPSSVFIYWITSNLFSFAQILTLRQPVIKRLLNIPDPKTVLASGPKRILRQQVEEKGFMDSVKSMLK